MEKIYVPLTLRGVRRTTLIGLFCAGLLAGLGLVQVNWTVFGWTWLVVAVCLLAICSRKRLVVAVPAVIAAGLLLGVWRGSAVQAELQTYQRYVGQKVTLVGTVIDDAGYGDKGQRDMRLQHVRLYGRSPPGSVRVTSFTFTQPRRGDVVQVTGKLYPGFGNYQAAIYYGDVTVRSVSQNPVEDIRHTFAAGLYSNLPDTQASLGLGILLGVKTQLPDDLNNQLKALSLTHIVVASGYNLTVLVRLARRLFEDRSKFQTAAVAAALMTGFVLVTGFSASMSRAALVSGLSLAAWYWGRRIHPVVLLAFAAALTGCLNPLYVWSDIGWWLSFLAFAGVLVLAPLAQHRLFGAKQPKLVGQIMLETSAAQIMTVPLTMAIFGTFSVLGLVANMVVVPLVPLGMLLTGIAGVASSMFGVFAAYFALPALWLLDYMVQAVAFFAAVPWASVTVAIDPSTMVLFYGVLILLCLLLWRTTKHDFLARGVIE